MITTQKLDRIHGTDAAGDRWCAFIRDASPTTIEVRTIDDAASLTPADAAALANWLADAAELAQ